MSVPGGWHDGPREYMGKSWSSLCVLRSHAERQRLFVLIREAFQEGPVAPRHLVWVCVSVTSWDAKSTLEHPITGTDLAFLNLQLSSLLPPRGGWGRGSLPQSCCISS